MTEGYPELFVSLPYYQDSACYFSRIRELDWPVFLDSAGTAGENGRYDILAAQPITTIRTHDDVSYIDHIDTTQQQSEQDPFTLLQNILAPYQASSCELPFCGGAIGYFAYDLGRIIETIPEIAIDAENMPQMAVGIYDWAIVVDHQRKSAWLCSHGFSEHTRQIWSSLQQHLTTPLANEAVSDFKVTGTIKTNLDKSQYEAAFNKIQHYITEGDCYQVNLAKRFEVAAEGDPWIAYQSLRKQNAAPFSAFMEIAEGSILSSSPERLLQVHQDKVETKPIKGTRPRDLNNAEHDKALADELSNSLKDRAENVMIVDLLRNDLGKVCQPGSIQVPKVFDLESFATVHHLVSTVTGQLAEDQTAVSLLQACFPGGSITGAPKLRAMEIIEELEPHRRGVYCGSIGYIGFDGNMDSNITIRTLVFNQNTLRFWAGGGIVTDSDMAAEHQEVQDKAAAMFKLVESLSE